MTDFNRVISFVLGLIVVVVAFLVISGRLGLGKKTATVAKVTPTPSVSAAPTQRITVNYPTAAPGTTNKYQANNNTNTTAPKTGANGVQNVTSIPNTGAETFLLPLALTGLLGGAALKKSKRSN